MTSTFDNIAKENNAEYVKRRVKEMIDNSKGGASVYSEVTNPVPSPEFMDILIEAMLQVHQLVIDRGRSNKSTARVCILVTLEGEGRDEVASIAQLPA